jgi:hypothetical protein
MSSQVEICNLAIGKLGSTSFITDINDENSKNALYCRLFYGPTRDALLRSHLWKFARKRAVLAPLVEEPLFDGGKYFQIANRLLACCWCRRIWITRAHNYGRWFVEGNKIVADTDVLNIVYIAKIEDESLYDPLFVQAFALYLAHEMSPAIAQSESMKGNLSNEMQAAIIRAAHAGSTEQDGQAFISEVFLRAHN